MPGVDASGDPLVTAATSPVEDTSTVSNTVEGALKMDDAGKYVHLPPAYSATSVDPHATSAPGDAPAGRWSSCDVECAGALVEGACPQPARSDVRTNAVRAVRRPRCTEITSSPLWPCAPEHRKRPRALGAALRAKFGKDPISAPPFDTGDRISRPPFDKSAHEEIGSRRHPSQRVASWSEDQMLSKGVLAWTRKCDGAFSDVRTLPSAS